MSDMCTDNHMSSCSSACDFLKSVLIMSSVIKTKMTFVVIQDVNIQFMY